MITDDKVAAVNAAMAAARQQFESALREADGELQEALAAYVPNGCGESNWNLIEAHNKHRNRIEAAAFAYRLAFLKAAGRRE